MMHQTLEAGSSLGGGSSVERSFQSWLRQLRAEAQTWHQDGKKRLLAGDIKTALTFFQNALAKAQAAGETELEAELHNACGCVLNRLGDVDAATAQFASAVNILQDYYDPTLPMPELLLLSKQNLEGAQRLQHTRQATEMLTEASAMLLGGEIATARNLLLNALPIAEHGAKDPLLECQLLNQLALTHGRERNLKAGISILKKAAVLVKRLKKHNTTAATLHKVVTQNLAHFKVVHRERPVWELLEQAYNFSNRNDFEHAEAAAALAAEKCRRKLGADHPAMAYALNRLGFCQLMMKDFDSAKRNLRAAKNIISKWPEHRLEAQAIGISMAWAKFEDDYTSGK